jgi:hypothetical protein
MAVKCPVRISLKLIPWLQHATVRITNYATIRTTTDLYIDVIFVKTPV